MWIEIALMVDCLTLQMVTPFAGVWIEIISVSKNHSVRNCHSPCESVDWNDCSDGTKYRHFVTPLAGVWIEIGIIISYQMFIFVTPLAGAWIKIWERRWQEVFKLWNVYGEVIRLWASSEADCEYPLDYWEPKWGESGIQLVSVRTVMYSKKEAKSGYLDFASFFIVWVKG